MEVTTKNCYFCSAPCRSELCDKCKKHSFLKSVKWHNFVKHLPDDRKEKGTLFPLISIEEGEHQFCTSKLVAQNRTRHGGNEVFETEATVEYFTQLSQIYLNLTGSQLQTNRIQEIIKKTPITNLQIPPCIWKDLWEPLHIEFLFHVGQSSLICSYTLSNSLVS